MESVPSLRDLQTRFLRSIAAAPGPSASDGFDPVLTQMAAAERLDVYAQMYWVRLVDVLREDFARVATCLGPERFGAVACRYLARHPSTHPSVRHAGARFAAFLAGDAEARAWPFLPDLARFEWARLDVFDAPDAVPLRAAELAAIPPADWADLVFRPIPALRLLCSPWPVHGIWAAAGDGAVDEAAGLAETHLRIWREGFTVYQASMDVPERTALERVLDGESFAAVCAALAATMTPEDAPREAAQLLLRWIEDGILVRGPH